MPMIPSDDFLNWSLIDSGAFDYAADAWGYSYGVAGGMDAGLVDAGAPGCSTCRACPTSSDLVRGFGQYELVTRRRGAPHAVGP